MGFPSKEKFLEHYPHYVDKTVGTEKHENQVCILGKKLTGAGKLKMCLRKYMNTISMSK